MHSFVPSPLIPIVMTIGKGQADESSSDGRRSSDLQKHRRNSEFISRNKDLTSIGQYAIQSLEDKLGFYIYVSHTILTFVPIIIPKLVFHLSILRCAFCFIIKTTLHLDGFIDHLVQNSTKFPNTHFNSSCSLTTD